VARRHRTDDRWSAGSFPRCGRSITQLRP
jgi:hypothetical protein